MTVISKTAWAIALGGLLLISILLTVCTHPEPYPFGLVDIQALVSKEAEALARLYPEGKVPLDKLQALSHQLQQTLDQFAQKKKIILFAKGALYAGEIPDFTQAIQEELAHE